MTFDITGLLIFLLGIVPGFLAQQSRSLLIPRSLRTKSVLEENRQLRPQQHFSSPLPLGSSEWFWPWLAAPRPRHSAQRWPRSNSPTGLGKHRYLIVSYYVTSLLCGSVLGAFRGILGAGPTNRNLARGQSLAKSPIGFVWVSSAFCRRSLYGTRRCGRERVHERTPRGPLGFEEKTSRSTNLIQERLLIAR